MVYEKSCFNCKAEHAHYWIDKAGCVDGPYYTRLRQGGTWENGTTVGEKWVCKELGREIKDWYNFAKTCRNYAVKRTCSSGCKYHIPGGSIISAECDKLKECISTARMDSQDCRDYEPDK